MRKIPTVLGEKRGQWAQQGNRRDDVRGER